MCIGTSLANPCTPEVLKKGQYYHVFPLDNHLYVQCDASGFPHIRPCPASLVWSAEQLTCVRAPAKSGKTPNKPDRGGGGGGKWQKMMSGGPKDKQQQKQQQQGSSTGSWKPATSWMVRVYTLHLQIHRNISDIAEIIILQPNFFESKTFILLLQFDAKLF